VLVKYRCAIWRICTPMAKGRALGRTL